MFAEHQTCGDEVPGSSARLLLQVQRRSQPAQLFMVSLFWLPFKMFAVLCLETPLLLSAIVLPNSTLTVTLYCSVYLSKDSLPGSPYLFCSS